MSKLVISLSSFLPWNIGPAPLRTHSHPPVREALTNVDSATRKRPESVRSDCKCVSIDKSDDGNENPTRIRSAELAMEETHETPREAVFHAYWGKRCIQSLNLGTKNHPLLK